MSASVHPAARSASRSDQRGSGTGQSVGGIGAVRYGASADCGRGRNAVGGCGCPPGAFVDHDVSRAGAAYRRLIRAANVMINAKELRGGGPRQQAAQVVAVAALREV